MKLEKNCRQKLSLLVVVAIIFTTLVLPSNVTFISGKSAAGIRTQESTVSYGVENPTVKDGVTTWDCIYFGNYWQNDTNGDEEINRNDEKQPIKWRVLSVSGEDAFLLADQNLDAKTYEKSNADYNVSVTWETCPVRTWLNDEFLNTAFSDSEQKAIKDTEVVNEDNFYNDGKGGNNTIDKIYLLSMAEASNVAYGFGREYSAIDPTRVTTDTAYAKDYGMHGAWLLRTPGKSNYCPAIINNNGYGFRSSYSLVESSEKYGVRPVLHLNLSTDVWRNAGKVSAVNKTIATATPIVSDSNIHFGLSNPTVNDDSTTWDCVYFGKYWQRDTNGDGETDQNDEKEPIKWRVLSVKGDDAFLLADQNLDRQPYNEEEEYSMTWEKCTLRKWLNDTFLNNAFSVVEQGSIKQTTVANTGNPVYSTEGEADTIDSIYLLSAEEACERLYGFDKLDAVKSQNTLYAQMGETSNNFWLGASDYWLRTSGGDLLYWSCRATYVHISMDSYHAYGNSYGYNGYGVLYWGLEVNSKIAVRPVLHLDLSSNCWKAAGKVTTAADQVVPTVEPTSVPSQKITSTSTPAPEGAKETFASVADTERMTGLKEQPPVAQKVTIKQVQLKKIKMLPKHRIKIIWKKNLDADCYEVQYSLNKKFKKAKTKKIKTNSAVITKLKSHKTYYIRVRARKSVGGKNIWGKWSKVKKAKCR